MAPHTEVQCLFTKFGEEWEELKRVYDEKLTFLAPTEYWRTRASGHKDNARSYAIAFGATLAVAMVLYATLASGARGAPPIPCG